jgi:hypothetical protein
MPASPEHRPSDPNDRDELERFRHDIDLVAFATSKGYAVDQRDSSRNCCMLRHANGDKIAVGRASDGHWQFYSFRDEKDNGDILQFVQNRAGGRHAYSLGAVRKELRLWTHTLRVIPPTHLRSMEPVIADRAAVAAAVARARVLDSHPYLESRGLVPETLSNARFRGTWRMDSSRHGNVLFPHYDVQGVCGFEIKNRDFTGFATGGSKGIWSSKVSPSDQRLVITESAIDALSYHQINPHPKTRYASLGGEQSHRQPALLESAISWMPAGSTIVAATDKDKAGEAFAKGVSELCDKHSHVTYERHAPKLGKDWNDHLQALRCQTRSVGGETKRHQGLQR